MLVTSRLRTMLDLARRSTFISAVTTLDAGLAVAVAYRVRSRRRKDGSAISCWTDSTSWDGAPGVTRARHAIEFASSLAGSPGESVSRVQMHLCRFPAPVLQFPVVDSNGTLWHADFGWPRFRLLGEFDGSRKYTRNDYTRGKPIEEIVWAEKKREDLMRGQGYGMARWLWDDALRAPLLTGILREAGLPRG